MAIYVGTNGPDYHTGSQQTQYGLDGNDTLSPSKDNKAYFLFGGKGDDVLSAYNHNDEIYGGPGRDTIYGYSGDDYIEGGTGNDMIFGNYGNDYLSGGLGRDVFVFDSGLNGKHNVDTISDYDTSQDLIDLDKSIFTRIGPVGESLKASKFVIGSHAQDSSDRIIYNNKNGVLKYDPDGTGPDSPTKFAVLDSHLDLTNADFFVI
jgi:serralysin